MVLVPVTVTDHKGKTIESLQAGDFDIFDDGVRQNIVSFASEDTPSSVGLVLDTSGSMLKTLGSAKDVAHAFFDTTNPADEFLLLTVSTQPAANSGFTTDIPALEKSIEFAKPGGLTALIDTVYLGLSRMREARHPRRALLVLSDGIDNHSRYSQGQLLSIALEADVQIYSIIFDSAAARSPASIPFRPGLVTKAVDRAAQNQKVDLLEKLADKTGGLHFRVHNATEAREGMLKAAQALRSEYVIGYKPPDLETPGKWHRVRVKTRVADVSVHARNGYHAR